MSTPKKDASVSGKLNLVPSPWDHKGGSEASSSKPKLRLKPHLHLMVSERSDSDDEEGSMGKPGGSKVAPESSCNPKKAGKDTEDLATEEGHEGKHRRVESEAEGSMGKPGGGKSAPESFCTPEKAEEEEEEEEDTEDLATEGGQEGKRRRVESEADEGSMGNPGGGKSAPESFCTIEKAGKGTEDLATEEGGKQRQVESEAEPQPEQDGRSKEEEEMEEPTVSCKDSMPVPDEVPMPSLFHQCDPCKELSFGNAENSHDALAIALGTLKCDPQEALQKLGWEMVSTAVNPEFCPLEVAILSLRTLLGGKVTIDESFSCKLVVEIRKGRKGKTMDICMKARDSNTDVTWHAGSWVTQIAGNDCVDLWSLVPKSVAYMAVLAVLKHGKIMNREEISFLLKFAKECK